MVRSFVALAILATAALAGPAPRAHAQTGAAAVAAEPFKLGTFEIDGRQWVGIVLRDQYIVELDAANRDLEGSPRYPKLDMPAGMLQLIERYEYGMKNRLYEIVTDLVQTDRLTQNRPGYIHNVGSVRTLAPILYPGKLLNAAGNFYSHVGEAGGPEEQRKAAENARRNRGVPYLFLKPTRGSIVGDDDEIVLPYGRTRTDWEVEIATVIGRAARYVPATEAENYVFGYTIMLDISDRGGRPPVGRQGSDWFVGKGHETFAPMGPWIVPKEFYGNPMDRLRQTLTLGGEQKQEATAGDMIHNIWELIEYGSSIVTLFPGDVINAGTSGGTGMSTTYRDQQQRFLQPGEKLTATIEGIGSLTMKVVAGAKPPESTGSMLPPVEPTGS